MVEDIISATNFKGDFNIKTLKEQITAITGAVPSITVDWKVSNQLNENTGENTVVEKADQIKIVWLDTDSNPHTLSYLI